MSKRNTWMLAGWLIAFMAIGNTLSAQVSVIVNKSCSQKVTIEDVRNIYTASTKAWDNGKPVTVVNQSGTETSKLFYENVVQKAERMVMVSWTKLVLSGQATAPTNLQTDEEVIQAVAKDPQAIGFVMSASVDGTVKEALKVE